MDFINISILQIRGLFHESVLVVRKINQTSDRQCSYLQGIYSLPPVCPPSHPHEVKGIMIANTFRRKPQPEQRTFYSHRAYLKQKKSVGLLNRISFQRKIFVRKFLTTGILFSDNLRKSMLLRLNIFLVGQIYINFKISGIKPLFKCNRQAVKQTHAFFKFLI